MHSAAMAPEHLGHLDGRGQTKARLGEHHGGEAPCAFVILATGEDRTRGIDEGELLVVARERQMNADHLDFCG